MGSGRRRSVVHVLQRGDVDYMPLPYTAHARDAATLLFLGTTEFEQLLGERLTISRRWLSSVAKRLAASQQRVIGLLGRSLTEQVAQLLLDEAADGHVLLSQRTLAAVIGVQRPSLNKTLKELERHGLIAVRYAAIEIYDIDGLYRRLCQDST